MRPFANRRKDVQSPKSPPKEESKNESEIWLNFVGDVSVLGSETTEKAFKIADNYSEVNENSGKPFSFEESSTIYSAAELIEQLSNSDSASKKGHGSKLSEIRLKLVNLLLSRDNVSKYALKAILNENNENNRKLSLLGDKKQIIAEKHFLTNLKSLCVVMLDSNIRKFIKSRYSNINNNNNNNNGNSGRGRNSSRISSTPRARRLLRSDSINSVNSDGAAVYGQSLQLQQQLSKQVEKLMKQNEILLQNSKSLLELQNLNALQQAQQMQQGQQMQVQMQQMQQLQQLPQGHVLQFSGDAMSALSAASIGSRGGGVGGGGGDSNNPHLFLGVTSASVELDNDELIEMSIPGNGNGNENENGNYNQLQVIENERDDWKDKYTQLENQFNTFKSDMVCCMLYCVCVSVCWSDCPFVLL